LAEKTIKRVALAEPACPLGKYSQDYLRSAHIYDKIAPKMLAVDNSRAVLAAVVAGAAEVGIAFASDAAQGGKWSTLLSIPTARASAEYLAVLLNRGKPAAAARDLFEFLSSAAARRAYRRCGLRPIGK
jgi:molybdate transport system substrate-binding protein